MKIKVAIAGFHEGNAGQVSEWFEDVTGMKIECFFCEFEPPPIINVKQQKLNRFSKRFAYPSEDKFKGKPMIWKKNWPLELKKRKVSHILPLISNNQERWGIIRKCKKLGFSLVSAIHPSAIISAGAKLEDGIWVNAKSFIGYKAELKSGSLVNTGAIIEHHNIVEECVQIDPAVVTVGNVALRARCHIHTGSIILNHVEIGADSIVGAGSLVMKSLPKKVLAFGSPAKVIKNVD